MDLTQMVVAIVGLGTGFGVIHQVLVTVRVRIREHSRPEYLLGRLFAKGEIDEADYVDRLMILRDVRELEPGK
jgi:uncharacterized membrane protein